MGVRSIERYQMDNFTRIIKSRQFISDLKEIELYIQTNYTKLHYHWGIKNKLKLAAERLVRFHIWKNSSMVELYNTPLSSDVAFVLNDCVINVDCKTIDLDGNSGDKEYIQCEQNQANFENINLNPCTIGTTGLRYEGASFYPILEKYYGSLPVLSFFVFINYRDNGTSFQIEELELCCMPHDDVVSSEYRSDIIQNFKTYKYLNENQAVKFNNYYKPVSTIQPHWVEFKIGSTKRYYDSTLMHPFDTSKLLIWGKINKVYKVVIGGHTIRVRKITIENRTDDNTANWKGWVKVRI